MKIYVAGKLGTSAEREFLEKIEAICIEVGFETFMPHRDVGFARGYGDAKRVFKGDIEEGLGKCDAMVVSLEGLHVGAGTAWEIGYAYSKGLPIIGIKIDESPVEGFEYLSAIIVSSVEITRSLKKLKKKLGDLIESAS
ncbi:MAG: nucleoside 2-deoxyribosyltransferase [Nanoarchaeota archaeon]